MTIRTKTSLLLVIFITVVFGVAGIFSLRFLENSLRKPIFTGLEGVSNTTSEVISKFLDETLKDSQLIAVTLPQKALEEKNVPIIEERLKTLMQAHPKF